MIMFGESPTLLSTASMNMLVEHAAAKAKSIGVAINIAVLDASTQMCGFLRMQGARIGAAHKAEICVAGGKSIEKMAAWVKSLPNSRRHSRLMRLCFTLLGGACRCGLRVSSSPAAGDHRKKTKCR
jgi:uncharacterized protein GlcG (DUF336 family)